MQNRFKRPARRPASRKPAPPVRQPLSGAVLDTVLAYSDVKEDLGGGRLLLRLSAQRLREREVKAALGDEARRAATVSILWNDREDQIIRVFEGPALAA